MPQPAVLHVIGGNDRGKLFELRAGGTSIGRGADQDIVLSDIAVSRRHITIQQEGARFRLHDLGSGNGTLLNGQRIDNVLLNDGDQIELGNTLMRFDHAASRAAVAAPAAAPAPAGGFAVGPPPPPPGPSLGSTEGYAYPEQPGATPSNAVPLPPTGAASIVPPRAGGTGTSLGVLAPFESPRTRLIAFGAMGGLSLIALIVIVSRLAFASHPVVPSDAETLYREGLRLFAEGNYEDARVKFNEAQRQEHETEDIPHYVAACDRESRAKDAIQDANRIIKGGQVRNGLRELDHVERTSIFFDEAAQIRHQNASAAADEAVRDAQRLQSEDPDQAARLVEEARRYDPNNNAALALAYKLKTGSEPPPPAREPPPATATTHEPPPTPPAHEPPPRETTPARVPTTPPLVRTTTPPPTAGKHTRKPSAPAGDDDELATVGKTKGKEPAGAPAAKFEPSAAVMAAYKARDFTKAEQLLRQDARALPPKQQPSANAAADQMRKMKDLLDSARLDEQRSPSQALGEYTSALGIDRDVGHGQLAGSLKPRFAPIARAAFAQSKYEVAFQAAQQAVKLGASDDGMLKQLEVKAIELINRATSLQKINPAQAKTLAKQAESITVSGPTHEKAYQLRNQLAAHPRDEDE